MTIEDNKTLVRRWVEGVNAGRPETSAAVVASDYRMNGQSLGPEGARQASAMLLTAFPDWHGSIEELVAKGDTVVVRLTYTGTHQGELVHPAIGRLPPTGKRVRLMSVELYRVAEGRIAESWVGSDRLGLLQQLGVIPAPQQASG
jgi:predicted ester cyclase